VQNVKLVKSSPPANHPVFLQAGCHSCHPTKLNQQCPSRMIWYKKICRLSFLLILHKYREQTVKCVNLLLSSFSDNCRRFALKYKLATLDPTSAFCFIWTDLEQPLTCVSRLLYIWTNIELLNNAVRFLYYCCFVVLDVDLTGLFKPAYFSRVYSGLGWVPQVPKEESECAVMWSKTVGLRTRPVWD